MEEWGGLKLFPWHRAGASDEWCPGLGAAVCYGALGWGMAGGVQSFHPLQEELGTLFPAEIRAPCSDGLRIASQII